MKKFMKKFGLLLTVVAVAVTSIVALTACNQNKKEFVTNLFEGTDNEDYAFCVKKGNTALLEQLNAFVAEESTKAALKVSMNYHTGVSDTTIEYPNLSDNTGATITMVTEAGFAPYEYTKTTGAGVVNKVGGVDVDMMMLFCEKYNYKLDLLDVEFKAIPTEVNKSDLYVGAAGMTVTEERKEVVDFATPYIQTKQYIISTKDSNYKTMADLKGKKIGVQESTTGNFMIEDALEKDLKGSNAECISYKKVSVAFQDLISGKLDAIVIDEFVAKGLVANYSAK